MSANVQTEENPSMAVPDAEAEALVSEMSLVFGRTVVPTPCKNMPMKEDSLRFEYAEHGFIGDAIDLTLANGSKVAAKEHKFTFPNGLVATYGQINGLAGDFYGTTNPISSGQNAQEQSARFMAAYNTLASPSSRMPKEAHDILAVLQVEIDAVNDALAHHEDPSVAYSKLPDVSAKLQLLTQFRPSGFPSYLGLATINWDHFGADARTAYNSGHALALQAAANGDLDRAYTINAFADHFLEDSFSAGHLRTPRRGLHKDGDLFADACAKAMHDEDNAIGLLVKNPAGHTWTCYGDKRALDKAGAENLKFAVAAVQASADEVYTAFTSRNVPPRNEYKAWTIAPTLESANGPQALAPLFRYKDASRKDVERRKLIKNRRQAAYTMSWWYWSTIAEITKSGWWLYPILIDGPPKILPHTSFAATKPHIWSTRLYYQNPAGGILESQNQDGQWTGGVDQPSLWEAAPFTPLAAINWDNGNQVRVYYLDKSYKLREYGLVDGKWKQGELDTMDIQCARNTDIAAFRYEDSTGRHIRVYCQVEGSNQIQEFGHDGHWYRGATLPEAMSGTGIAAIVYNHHGWRYRVYYQTQDLVLREHCLNLGQDDKLWFPGAFNVGRAPGRTQIGVLCGTWRRGVILDVYWLNMASEITRAMHIDGYWQISKVVGPLFRSVRFVAEQWDGGKHIRVYYQSKDNSVLEVCNDNGEQDWVPGSHVAQA
ncbi:fungal fucose-specific lectin-domain-containing protein [Schizophyllum fasciatum]